MMKVYSWTLTVQVVSPIRATTEVQEFSDCETVIQVKAEIAPALALFQSLCSAWLISSAMAVDLQAEDALMPLTGGCYINDASPLTW